MEKETISLITSGLLLIGSLFFIIGTSIGFLKDFNNFNDKKNGNGTL
ncbi:hypothetical protein ACERII_04710 [Evansella sp. AB-rgal1]